MRKQREQELEEYRILCSKIESDVVGHPENLILKRRSILTLELPFKTDAVSVNQALIEEKDFFENPRQVEEDLPKSTDYLYNAKYREASFENFLHSESIWPKAIEIKYSSKGNITFKPAEKIPEEDLDNCSLPCHELMKNISNYPLKESSKKVYHCLARQYITPIQEMDVHMMIAKVNRRIGIESDCLAAYFNYLEERCLKSGSLRHYRDLIEVRLLFYVPITSKDLNQCKLSNINESTQLLRCRGTYHRLPTTLIELIRATIPEDEPLLKRDTKQLNKFVSQTSATIGLKNKITPKLIRRSQDFIAHREGYIKERLPLR